MDETSDRHASARRSRRLPEADLGVATAPNFSDSRHRPPALVERAHIWRPWRAYAVQYLWSVDDHRIQRLAARVVTVYPAMKGNEE